MSSLISHCTQVAKDARAVLHTCPEVAWDEFETAKFVRRFLDVRGLEWHSCAKTGTVARIPGRTGRRHIALRADMDALPIFASRSHSQGVRLPRPVHACGHDGHVASLLGVAEWLWRSRRQCGPVTLLFQPAEEGGFGARCMIEEGALESVDAIYGWHNLPDLDFGMAACSPSVMMCANGVFDIRVFGTGGHASRPDQVRNPVAAAASIVAELHQLPVRVLPPQEPSVVAVTSIDGVSDHVVVRDYTDIKGSVRGIGLDRVVLLLDSIRDTASMVAASHGCSIECDVSPRYGATINHSPSAAAFSSAIREAGLEVVASNAVPLPLTASEDFGQYLEHVPGAFALFGGNEGRQFSAPLHSPEYMFNDRVLEPTIQAFAQLLGAMR